MTKKWMKKAIFTILVSVLVLNGCSLSRNDDNKASDQKVGLANPASTFCVEQGGELEMRNNKDGQYGVCKFEDGTECEEWAFYRLECKPGGEVKAESEKVESNDDSDTPPTPSQEGTSRIDNNKIKVFDIESNDNITSPVTIKGETSLDTDSLIVEIRNKDHEALVQEKVNIRKGDSANTFEITLNFEFANTKEGFVAVYEQSAKDESELNLVEIPVRFNDKQAELQEAKKEAEQNSLELGVSKAEQDKIIAAYAKVVPGWCDVEDSINKESMYLNTSSFVDNKYIRGAISCNNRILRSVPYFIAVKQNETWKIIDIAKHWKNPTSKYLSQDWPACDTLDEYKIPSLISSKCFKFDDDGNPIAEEDNNN